MFNHNKENLGHIHDCNNATCQLLNPSLKRLLQYEDLRERVYKAEEIFHDILHMDIKKSLPLGLFGWASYHQIYQLLNIEFIRELVMIIREIDPQTILEVGAGQGLLGEYLSKELNKEILLIDDYSWWKSESLKLDNNNVLKMDYKKAINKFKPDLIIASWIPYKRWWTKDFVGCESVKGYILIGEGYGGCTGSDMDWETNWILENLEDVERFGICRSDHIFFRDIGINKHTNVTYFKRP